MSKLSGDSDESVTWGVLLQGDPHAFAVIFELHRDRVYGQSLRLTRDVNNAHDITAMVFLEAWRRRGDVRVVEGSIIGWLLVTANFIYKNFDRSRRRYEHALSKLPSPEDQPDHSDNVLEQLGFDERAQQVRDAFNGMGLKDQAVLTLCVINEYPVETAAQTLGIPVGTVKSRLSRAKQKLAKTLTEEASFARVPEGNTAS